MLRARFHAAFIGFSHPSLIARGLGLDGLDKQVNDILQDLSHLRLELDANRSLGRTASRFLLNTTMDAAIKAVERTMPREPDDPWWDGYDGGIADAKHDLAALRADLLREFDEAMR